MPVEELPLSEAEQALLADAPSPAFLRETRNALRARHARLNRHLRWFDLELPVGQIRVVHDGVLVHLVTNAPDTFEEQAARTFGFEPAHGASERIVTEVRQVLGGARRGDLLAYLDELAPFQRAILKATARIPRGEVRPYAWVAREAGSPGAVRAAGTALGHNPVPLVVPCHRVVRSDWALGQYSAAGGAETKARVLRWEGCDVEGLAAIAHARIAFIGDSASGSFCLAVCETLGTVPPESRIAFRTAEAALAAGLVPCEHCRPVAMAS
ncbi:MAG: cysteine methyltransferase [Anaerolinea sp.]|nr:cysteine methyltransferase [Anaerolinea sp.]